jgi:hypothetical protein
MYTATIKPVMLPRNRSPDPQSTTYHYSNLTIFSEYFCICAVFDVTFVYVVVFVNVDVFLPPSVLEFSVFRVIYIVSLPSRF